MAIQTGSKLQQLLSSWPSGAVFTSVWLKERGYSHVLLSQYRKAGWLTSIGRGAMARPGDQVDWRGGLYALQEQLKLSIHLGGKSALHYHGFAHFLNLGSEAVTLFAAPGTRLPSWFTSYDWKAKVSLTTTNLFSQSNLLSNELGLASESIGAFAIKLSSRERALFETLHLVPQTQSLEEVKLFMSGLTNLRPQLVQSLLETCSSIKVKRLFMLFAEELKMPWVKKLNLDNVNFGTGARTLIKGGKTHPKYLLTIPTDLFDGTRQ